MEPETPGEQAEQGASEVSEAAALFCLIAARSGLLSQARADEALAARGDVAEVCVARGWLTDAQARTVLSHVVASEAPEPAVDGEDAREFARLVAMKRLAGDGQVDACRDLQKDLAGGAYGRLSELLVRKASRRSGAVDPAQPEGMPDRAGAFDVYVKLKQAVQRGDIEAASALAGHLRGDPQFGRLAETQLTRAFARRAVTDARRTGAGIAPCATCGAPSVTRHAANAQCGRCLSKPPQPNPTAPPSE